MTDCKSIGNKIVLKGVARLDAIYLDESGNLASMSSELPFSQILDGLAEEEGETTVRASLRLTGAEIYVGSESEPDNNRAISLRLYISAFTAVREVKSVCCVADLYSTACDLTAKTETVELCDSAALVLREQLVREKIETGAEVQTVLATDVIFSSAGVSGGGESASLRATANLRVLYLDENAVPLLSERRSEVLIETDLPGSGQARVQDMYAGEIAASVGADGVELRFPVTFAVSVAETPRYPCLQSLEAEECGKKDENVPSLVLRAMKQGERLWDIAKLYRTTVEAILAANEPQGGIRRGDWKAAADPAQALRNGGRGYEHEYGDLSGYFDPHGGGHLHRRRRPRARGQVDVHQALHGDAGHPEYRQCLPPRAGEG